LYTYPDWKPAELCDVIMKIPSVQQQ
jgi:hypothetical protein